MCRSKHWKTSSLTSICGLKKFSPDGYYHMCLGSWSLSKCAERHSMAGDDSQRQSLIWQLCPVPCESGATIHFLWCFGQRYPKLVMPHLDHLWVRFFSLFFCSLHWQSIILVAQELAKAWVTVLLTFQGILNPSLSPNTIRYSALSQATKSNAIQVSPVKHCEETVAGFGFFRLSFLFPRFVPP